MSGKEAVTCPAVTGTQNVQWLQICDQIDRRQSVYIVHLFSKCVLLYLLNLGSDHDHIGVYPGDSQSQLQNQHFFFKLLVAVPSFCEKSSNRADDDAKFTSHTLCMAEKYYQGNPCPWYQTTALALTTSSFTLRQQQVMSKRERATYPAVTCGQNQWLQI